MFTRVIVAIFTVLLIIPTVCLAVENEAEAPASFVMGTRDYTIPYLEKMRVRLAKYFKKNDLAQSDNALANAKVKNRALLKRLSALKAAGGFLKEKDG